MEVNKTFNELFCEAAKNAGLTPEKLAAVSDIPAKCLNAFFGKSEEAMPAAPYVRGYLYQAAFIMGVNAEELWQAYKKDFGVKSSGSGDRLPENRFIRKTGLSPATIATCLSGALFIAIAVWGIGVLRTPRISIVSPENNLLASASTIILSGSVSGRDKLMINGEEVAQKENGEFSKEFMLQKGVNTFEFKVKRFLGREARVVRQVIYEPKERAVVIEPIVPLEEIENKEINQESQTL